MKNLLLVLFLSSSLFAATPLVGLQSISITSGTWNYASSGTLANTYAGVVNTNLNNLSGFLSSVAFSIPSTETIQGVMLVVAKGSTPTNPCTVGLYAGGTTLTSVTVPVASIPSSFSWLYFPFPSAITGTGTNGYTIQMYNATPSNVIIYYNGPFLAKDVYRLLVTTTTTSSPGSVSPLFYGGNISTPTTLTLDDTTGATAYNGLSICYNGKAAVATGTNKTYNHQFAGNIIVYGGGELDVGTTVTPFPMSSKSTIQFQCTTPAQYGLYVYDGATWSTQPAALKYPYLMMAADGAVGATTMLLTGVSTCNWSVGDIVAVAPTGTVNTQYGTTTLLTLSGTTGIASFTPALVYFHSGTSPTQAEVIDTTRNIVFKGASAANGAYITLQNASTCPVYGSEFTWLRPSATSNVTCVYIGTGFSNNSVSGVDVEYCSFHDNDTVSGYILGYIFVGFTNVNFSNNVFYGGATNIVAIGGVGPVIMNNNCSIGGTAGAYGSIGTAVPSTIMTNNHVSGSTAYGLYIYPASSNTLVSSVVSGNVCHNNAIGMAVGGYSGTVSNCTLWGNTSGLTLGVGAIYTTQQCKWFNFNNMTIFGNKTVSIEIGGFYNCVFNNLSENAGTYPWICPVGIYGDISGPSYMDSFVNSTFGGTHSIGAFSGLNGVSPIALVGINCYNCTFTPPEFGNQTSLITGSSINSSRHNGVLGAYKSCQSSGSTQSDNVIYNAIDCPISERVVPLSATSKMTSQLRKFNVQGGQTASPYCFIRQSLPSDSGLSTPSSGTAPGFGGNCTYNGNPIRFMVAASQLAGITTNTVLATYTPVTGIILSAGTFTVAPGRYAIICTTSSAHSLSTNDCLTISGGTGLTAINGSWKIAVLSTTSFELLPQSFSPAYTGTYNSNTANYSKWIKVVGTTPSPPINTILNCYVDCDGTTGFVNVDWPSGEFFWADGQPDYPGQSNNPAASGFGN